MVGGEIHDDAHGGHCVYHYENSLSYGECVHGVDVLFDVDDGEEDGVDNRRVVQQDTHRGAACMMVGKKTCHYIGDVAHQAWELAGGLSLLSGLLPLFAMV